MKTRHLRLFLCSVAAWAALLLVHPAGAQSIDPGLESVLERLGPDDRASVIVRFAGGPKAGTVNGADRHARRTEIVRSLKKRSRIRSGAVERFLADPSVSRPTELWLINGLALTASADVIRALAESPEVVRISLDEVIESPVSLEGKAAVAEWNLEAIHAPELWSDGIDGAGVVIGSMDTGVDETHPDLAASYRSGSNSWYDPYDEHADPHDRSGHGTQVMGVMVGGSAGGSAIGVAPGAQWIAAKIFDDAGQSTLSAIHQSFQWMLDPDDDPETDDGADIVNNSWSLQNIGECSLEFEDDLRQLRLADVAVVFSAGNYGSNTDTSVSPANNPSGFGVGFVNDSDTIHISSSRGPSVCDGSVYPEVVAPGVNVRTADLGAYYAWASGASIAAPHVSGAIALLRSAHPLATVGMLEKALEASAVDLGAIGPDSTYGHGRIDLVVAEEVLGHLVAKSAVAAAIYTDEGEFLAAVGGMSTVTEGFEDDGAWGAARNPDSFVSVASQGLTWTSNHAANEISTSAGAAYSGSWGLYSDPHGDQAVPNPTDFISDGVLATSDLPLTAVGGWIRSTNGGEVVAILDGDDANPVTLGPTDATHRYYGLVTDQPFTTIELREIEGTREDQKYIFVDDVTVAQADGAVPTMDGVLSGVANVPGAEGSDWHTDLFVHNASAASISVELYYSPEGDVPGAPVLAAMIGPDETRTFEDVVATVFAAEGSGAISWRVVAGDADGLVVSANTYNRVDSVKRYGVQVEGIRWSDAAPAGTRVLLPGFAGRYRTNLGIATDGDCSVVVVRVYDSSSTLAAQTTIGMQPWSWLQLNKLFRRVFPNLVPNPDTVSEADSLHRFEVIGVNGRVRTYTSIIDNTTNDGSYMVGQVPGVDAAQWLPGAAVIEGANASNWLSDVVVVSTAGVQDSVDFAFYPKGQDNSGPPVRWNVPLGIGESLFIGDILSELFGYSSPSVGSLSVSSNAAQPLLWMRTYTEEPIVGGDLVTYGLAIMPRAAAATIVAGNSGHIAGFSHDATTRANLILQNTRAAADGSRLSSEIRVELLAADGSLLHEQNYSLLPGEYRQHNRFVAKYGVAPVEGVSLRVTVLDQPAEGEIGGVDAMVSEVNGNNVAATNDGRLMRATILPPG